MRTDWEERAAVGMLRESFAGHLRRAPNMVDAELRSVDIDCYVLNAGTMHSTAQEDAQRGAGGQWMGVKEKNGLGGRVVQREKMH